MREVVQKFNVYSFDNASSELKEKIIEYFSYDSFLYDFCLSERIETLKAFADAINGELDYSISCVSDRGEFITIKDFSWTLLKEILKDNTDCPFTGVCYDDDLLYDLRDNKTMNETLENYLKSIHDEYSSMLTNEYISDLCEANDYEFTGDGKMY